MWQRKVLEYDICIPPLSKPYALLSSEEASDYFKWYVDKIPERIVYLSKIVSQKMGNREDRILLSPESLVIVWKWFLSVAKTEMDESGHLQLDLQTEYIIRDIGMYLGELFNSRHESINWSYYETPKADFFVNRPVLTGFLDKSVSPPFQMVFEPIHMVRVQASRILTDRQKEDDLLRVYKNWEEKIPVM